MKTEIKIVNENKNLTQTELKSILTSRPQNITIEVINKEISETSIQKIQNLKQNSSNFTDFVNRLNKTMAKTNVYSGVELIYHDKNFISLLFKKKNFFNWFVYDDITASFTLNNVFKDFDTVETQIGLKPQFNRYNSNLNYLRTGFLFSMPLMGFDKNWAFTVFNRNKLYLSTEHITTVNSLKGLQLSYDHKHLSIYAKENFDKKPEISPFKWVLRYKDKNLFNILSADLKASIDNNNKIDYIARIAKEITWPFVYLKNGFFIKNKIDAVYSNKRVDLDSDKSCYHFNTERQSSNLVVNNTIRLGTINSLGKQYYSIFSFANFLAYRKNGKFEGNFNAGIGGRLFMANNFVLEGLINLDKRKDQKRAICRVIYGD